MKIYTKNENRNIKGPGNECFRGQQQGHHNQPSSASTQAQATKGDL